MKFFFWATRRRNNSEVTLWNTDNYEYAKFEGKQLYQAHPWILGVLPEGSSFGILADNSWRQEIVLENPIEIIGEGPSFRLIVIEKETPQEVMKTLADLTGTMAMLPLWALGYQQWTEDLKMPKGNWQTVTFEGEEKDPYQATVKLREGAIVPVGPVIQSTEDYSTENITLLINLDKSGKAFGTLYDDAGEGFEYKEGEYSIHEFTASKTSKNKIKVKNRTN